MKAPKGFWLVWNPQRGSPTYRHETHASAVAEAHRLASKSPGESFYVLGCVGRAIKQDVRYDEITSLIEQPQLIDEDDLPF